MMQFAFISLIPGLIYQLQDCADPALDQYASSVSKATSLKTSERASCKLYSIHTDGTSLIFASDGLHGSPFANFWKGEQQIPLPSTHCSFHSKGSFFGPYTPLQQLDILADYGTKSYIVGSTNSLLLQQKDKYSDILINLDETTVNITSSSLRAALSLSAADRRWIDFLTQTVLDTWDPAHPSRPDTLGYAGSEEFIQLQFEEYLLALLASTSYHDHLGTQRRSSSAQSPTPQTPDDDPSVDFSPEFIYAWKQTSNYALFARLTAGSNLFDIVEPKHPTAGGLSVEDVQRRLAQQVAELHLDERMREGKETLNKQFAIGKERFGQLSSRLWADLEALREAQKARASQRNSASSEGGIAAGQVERTDKGGSQVVETPSSASRRYAWPTRPAAPDLTQVQATAKDASAKAGAYLSSWGSWAKDKGKEWQEKRVASSTTSPSSTQTPKPMAPVAPVIAASVLPSSAGGEKTVIDVPKSTPENKEEPEGDGEKIQNDAKVIGTQPKAVEEIQTKEAIDSASLVEVDLNQPTAATSTFQKTDGDVPVSGKEN